MSSGKDDRRKLRLQTQMGASGPVLIAATVIACGSSVVLNEPPGGAGGGGGAGGDGGMQTSQTSQGEGGFVVSSTSVGGSGPCDSGFMYDTIVEVPAEGTPAEAGEICAVVMGPVESNFAARVTLAKSPAALEQAQGTVTLEPALLPLVVASPTVEVIDSPIPELLQATISNVQPAAEGFTFDVEWPPLSIEPDEYAVMIVRTTFDITCEGAGPPTRAVAAHTHINLCLDDGDDVTWVSSGDECTICGIIAEMAPSPIVPGATGDDLALGRVIRLRLVIVAQVGDALVLWAEHDGGDDVDYDWVASGGEVQRIAPDMVVWTPVRGEAAVMQVAVASDDGAAVASYTDVPVRAAGLVA